MHVAGGRPAEVHDEVGVDRRDRGLAHAVSLEARAVDEPSGEVTFVSR